MNPLLLCTDLDRTLLPNGPQPEPEWARTLFRRLVESEGVTLVFATGRDRNLVEQAIAEYDLPLPDYVIGDVGTSIHHVEHSKQDRMQWELWDRWHRHIAPDWKGLSHAELASLLQTIPGMKLQEPGKQAPCKLSYYVELIEDHHRIVRQVRERLDSRELDVNLIWSVDEAEGVGLLDVLPARASKLHALRYLQAELGIANENTVFAGDSGNDLPVLVSPVPSVLVANALPEVAQQARQQAAELGNQETLYLAQGGFLGMDGFYAAGILEGVAHYHPDAARRIRQWHESIPASPASSTERL